MADPLRLVLTTDVGILSLDLLPAVAPRTVAHVTHLVQQGIYDGTQFYRSDFVIQFGLHGSPKPTGVDVNLPINETYLGQRVSNRKGTMSVAHFDVPDCGGSEFFLNLQENSHLDSTYGGYCVFAHVSDGDAVSWQTADAIASTIKARGGTVLIQSARII